MSMKIRNISFVLAGVAILVLKSHYSGPGEIFVHCYAGNIAVSFAVYFIVLQLPFGSHHQRLWSAGSALAAVELFEVLDGFGIMSNVFDPWDLPANAAGVAAGFALDTILALRQ
jgi:hypothetical protein